MHKCWCLFVKKNFWTCKPCVVLLRIWKVSVFYVFTGLEVIWDNSIVKSKTMVKYYFNHLYSETANYWQNWFVRLNIILTFCTWKTANYCQNWCLWLDIVLTNCIWEVANYGAICCSELWLSFSVFWSLCCYIFAISYVM